MKVFENSAIKVGLEKNCFWATAPSNIALIKYMGKSCDKENVADNVSLSFTLKDKLAKVELYVSDSWSWYSLDESGMRLSLDSFEQTKYIEFAKKVSQQLGLKNCFLIKSGCNFPVSCGIASSAASFAALTSCLVNAASFLIKGFKINFDSIVDISKHGSGSSVRSFLNEWVMWDLGIQNIDNNFKDCRHKVVTVCSAKKEISSSNAHKLVKTSLLYDNRNKRALCRFNIIKEALVKRDWRVVFEQSWREFWDMHSLFHTADPFFSYIKPDTLYVLDEVRLFWQKNKDGPVVTLDAGANVHFIYRSDQDVMINEFLNKFRDKYLVL